MRLPATLLKNKKKNNFRDVLLNNLILSMFQLLSQYMHGRLVPNFPEAAMVINSAGQVYSRKVDYLEALLMAMHDKQNAPDRNDKPDNPDGAEKPTTEKKR